MPQALQLLVGTATVSVPIKLTAVQLRAVVRRFVARKGFDVSAMTDTQIGETALRAMLKDAAALSSEQQREDALQAQRAALEEQIRVENEMFDPPT